jgi:uncharacterized membrane protein
MKKNRLEAFSDGVFAIVITLLILNVKLPEVDYNHLQDGLADMLSAIGVYALSFLLIGMYWVFHHHTFSFISEVDGILLWVNILFLLFLSFLPFPTAMLGKYPLQTLPIVAYGINLILLNVTGFIGIVYLKRNMQLSSEVFTEAIYRGQLKMYYGVNAMYLVCIIIAFFSPLISILCLAILTLYLIIRSVIFVGIGKCVLPAGMLHRK